MASQTLNAGAQGLGRRRAGIAGARIDDGGNLNPRRCQVGRRPIGRIVVGEDDAAPPRTNGEPVGVGACRRGQHDPRPVVIGEDERAFCRPCGQHYLAGAYHPQALARLEGQGLGQVVGHVLGDGQPVVVVITEYRGAAHQGNVGHGGQLGHRHRRPFPCRGAIDGPGLSRQRAAEFGAVVGYDDPRTGTARGNGRRQSRRPAANDQNVAMGEAVFVAVGVGLAGRHAHAGQFSQHVLVGRPKKTRPLEGLVIKTGRHEARYPSGSGT